MGRNMEYMEEIRKAVDINFLYSTGFYIEQFYPEIVFQKTNKELAEIMINEIKNGIENTGIKPEVIGEIGSSKDIITEQEKKVFQAASIAHEETGKVLLFPADAQSGNWMSWHDPKVKEAFNNNGISERTEMMKSE